METVGDGSFGGEGNPPVGDRLPRFRLRVRHRPCRPGRGGRAAPDIGGIALDLAGYHFWPRSTHCGERGHSRPADGENHRRTAESQGPPYTTARARSSSRRNRPWRSTACGPGSRVTRAYVRSPSLTSTKLLAISPTS